MRGLDNLAPSDFDQLGGCVPAHLDRDKDERRCGMERYNNFIYVDDEVLQEFGDIPSANTIAGPVSGSGVSEFVPRFEHNVAIKVVLAESDPDPDEPEDDDGSTKTWQRLHVFRYSTFYRTLMGSNEAWFGCFRRPRRLNKFPITF